MDGFVQYSLMDWLSITHEEMAKLWCLRVYIVIVFSVLFPSITRLCNVVYLRHVNKKLGMFVRGEGTPLQTEECRIPYAEEYLESTFRIVRTQGSTPTYSHYVLSSINAPGTARKVSVSYTDQDTDYFESYFSFSQLFPRQIQGHQRLILQFTMF